MRSEPGRTSHSPKPHSLWLFGGLLALVLSSHASAATNKVKICHRPPDNPLNIKLITVSKSEADFHLRYHKDNLVGPEVCDGVDNDCDGTPDDGISDVITGTETGACQSGIQRCTSGRFQIFQPEITPVAEVCDGVDNDCDGTPDDGISDVITGTETGACQSGIQRCTSGRFHIFQPEITPVAEVCDGVDNDCDDSIDNGDVCDGTPPNNQPPVAIARSSSRAMGFAKVTLDGSSSGDPDGQIASYAWTQIAGPQVNVQSASESIANFNAPSVTSITVLRFQLHVEDDKGATSNADVAIEVFPADSADLQVKFMELEYLKPSANQDSHADYFPIAGSPVANEEIKTVATLSGLIKDVTFELRGLTGNVIGPASLTRLDDSAIPPFVFGGDVTIPDQPFLFAAFGNTQDGQNFDVTFSPPVTPEHFRVLFTPRLLELKPGEKFPVTLLIENGGQKDTFEVDFSDLYGLLESSDDTSVEIDAGATKSIPLKIVAPQNTPFVDPTPLRVYVTAQSNANKQLAAELLLTVERAP